MPSGNGPTRHLPGSPAKKDALADRARLGLPLFQEGDVLHDPKRSLKVERLRNGRDRLVGESDVEEATRGENVSLLCDRTPGSPKRAVALAVYGSVKLGERLHSLRLARGLSLGQVALETGLAKWQVSRLEKGKNWNATLAVLWALADCYRVSVDWLIGRE